MQGLLELPKRYAWMSKLSLCVAFNERVIDVENTFPLYLFCHHVAFADRQSNLFAQFLVAYTTSPLGIVLGKSLKKGCAVFCGTGIK